MFKFKQENGKGVPLTLCDVCGAEITNAKGALVVWMPATEGEFIQHYHVHKGACDHELQARLGGAARTHWMEMSSHFFYLCHNAGMTPALFEKAKEFAEIF